MTKMFEFVAATWNPASGCDHDCPYCLTGDTKILTSGLIWKPVSEIKTGDKLLGFDENPTPNHERGLKITEVTNLFRRKSKVYQIITEHGKIRATADHPWLTDSNRWRTTSQLRDGWIIQFLTNPTTEEETQSYMRGYITGIFDGDGTMRLLNSHKHIPGHGGGKSASYARLALIDEEPLYRTQRYLSDLIEEKFEIKPFNPGHFGFPSVNKMYQIGTWSSKIVKKIMDLREDGKGREFKRGYISGIFDAEGSYSGGILRIHNKDIEKIKRIEEYGKEFNFSFKREEYEKDHFTLRLSGRIGDKINFFSLTNPSLSRKKNILGTAKFFSESKIKEVEKIGEEEVYNLETTSSTFFANGFASHNCWARKFTERFNRKFTPSLNEMRLLSPPNVKEGEMVFVVSNGDLFCAGMKDEWIERVLNASSSIEGIPLFLTKNPSRFNDFVHLMPERSILGATVETNLDKLITWDVPKPSVRLLSLRETRWDKKFISIEPVMDFNYLFSDEIGIIKPQFVAIGYDNYNCGLEEPPLKKVDSLIRQLEEDYKIKVYKKSIRKAHWE